MFCAWARFYMVNIILCLFLNSCFSVQVMHISEKKKHTKKALFLLIQKDKFTALVSSLLKQTKGFFCLCFINHFPKDAVK